MNQSELQQFHDNLRAAVVAGAPLEINEKSSWWNKYLSLSMLDRLQEKVSPFFSGSQSDPASEAGDAVALKWNFDSESGSTAGSSLPVRYLAALKTFLQTGSMVPVLEGLTVRPIARRKSIRALRWAFIYLFILLAFAFWGISVFNNAVAPEFQSMKEDLLLPAAIKVQPRFDIMPWVPSIAQVLFWTMVVFSIFLLIGGIRWSVMWLGGRRFVQDRISSTALRTLQLLVKSGMPMDEALSVSCDLAGADDFVRTNLKQAAIAPEHFGTLADYLAISAEKRIDHLKFVIPIGIVCTVGGVVTLIFGMIVFWPIISLLYDLTTAGT